MKKKIDSDLVMQAAVKCFSRYGYKKTTLEDIAGELGILASGMYAYADSKRDLYEQTVRYALLRWQNRVKENVAQAASPREKLLALMHTALTFLGGDEAFTALLRNDPSIFPMFPASDPYEEINAESASMIASILEKGIRSGDFRPLDAHAVADVIFSLYKSFIIHVCVHGDSEYLAEHMENTIDLIMNGIYAK